MIVRDYPQAKVIWGLGVDKWRELSAFALCILGLLVFLSLMSHDTGGQWMGTAGSMMAFWLRFFTGRVVSYVLPALLLLAAVHAFQERSPFHVLRKGLSAGLILVSLCAFLTLRHVLHEDVDSRTASFQAGGVIGNFFTSDDGLGMASRCGIVGSSLLCLAVLLAGVMLSTDFLFLPMVQDGWVRLQDWYARLRQPKPVAVLRFEPSGGAGTYPVAAGEGRAEGRAKAKPVVLDTEEEEEQEAPGEGFAVSEASGGIADQAARGKRERAEPSRLIQTELNFEHGDFEPPPLDLLSSPPRVADPMDREEAVQVSNELEEALSNFSISARVVAVTQGPVVTRYELQPAPGVKVSRILSLENDIALVLKAKSVRIQAPIPGKAAVGIEVPNRRVSPVYFRDIVASDEFRSHSSPLAFALGKNISGEPVICDLAEMPHLLIAGTTGSGKSVCINVIISSILYRMPPDKVKFIMVDPKRVELNVYSDIPHLLAPVVNEPRQAAAALAWAAQQMDERLQLFSDLKVRNIAGYNALISGEGPRSRTLTRSDLKYLPHIVIIIDELADLMLIAKNEVEEFIVRLAQMSRAAGIHMIIATQRPSVNVITGIIKANFPSRIAFRVSAKVDSRTILDMNGAETLLGRGDMLFSPGGIKPMRIQGAFLSDSDVEVLTNHIRSKNPVSYEKQEFEAPRATETSGRDFGDSNANTEENAPSMRIIRSGNEAGRVTPEGAPASGHLVEFPSITFKDDVEDDEELYDRALRMVLESRKPSVSMIQRRLKIGFARAGRLMDLMEERGIVGPYQGSKPRDLLIEPEPMLKRLDEIEREKSL